MTSQVQIIEVGPRDGLQNEASPVSTETKIELIRRLAAAGAEEIEATAFVNPKRIPQLADAADVMVSVSSMEQIRFSVLVPNLIGYERVRPFRPDMISLFTAATDGFTEANIGTTVAGSIERFRAVAEAARADGMRMRGYISTAFGCPFDGDVKPAAVVAVAEKLLSIGVHELAISDTIGVAVPRDIEAVVTAVQSLVDSDRIALHLHDTRGTGLVNAWQGLALGVTRFDTSVGGLGGCPYAPGASGNLATEDLVWMLERNGVATGIDFDGVADTARWILSQLGREGSGHLAGAPRWPR